LTIDTFENIHADQYCIVLESPFENRRDREVVYDRGCTSQRRLSLTMAFSDIHSPRK